LLWEGPLASHDGLSRSLQGQSARLLPASNLEGCLKWLETSSSIDALVLSLARESDLRYRDYQNLKRRPEMLDVPTLVLVSKERLKAHADFITSCEDFIVDDAGPEEIGLRIQRLLKPSSSIPKSDSKMVHLGALEIFPKSLKVLRNGKELKLTPLEFRLLLYFYRYQGRVLKRDELLHQVWGYDDISHTRTVDTFVKRLRSKLGSEGRFIETMRAVGYRLKSEEIH